MWGVFFDVSRSGPEFEMEGKIRWVDVGGPLGPYVMYESVVVVSRDEPFFYSGLGDQGGRVWKRGVYRVEFLDDRGLKVVAWDFEVR